MEERSILQLKRQKHSKFAGELFRLTLTGGIVFWVTSIATSLLPIAAQYRAAFSNWSIYTVWIGSFFMGMLNSFVVSWLLLRIHGKSSDLKVMPWAVFLSAAALILALALVDLPMFLQGTCENSGYFFVGIAFNVVRFVLLGLAIGYSLIRIEK